MAKTPPTSEDAGGVFDAFTSRKVAALGRKCRSERFVPALPNYSAGNYWQNGL
jgi:hypothetical protein